MLYWHLPMQSQISYVGGIISYVILLKQLRTHIYVPLLKWKPSVAVFHHPIAHLCAKKIGALDPSNNSNRCLEILKAAGASRKRNFHQQDISFLNLIFSGYQGSLWTQCFKQQLTFRLELSSGVQNMKIHTSGSFSYLYELELYKMLDMISWKYNRRNQIASVPVALPGNDFLKEIFCCQIENW